MTLVRRIVQLRQKDSVFLKLSEKKSTEIEGKDTKTQIKHLKYSGNLTPR